MQRLEIVIDDHQHEALLRLADQMGTSPQSLVVSGMVGLLRTWEHILDDYRSTAAAPQPKAGARVAASDSAATPAELVHAWGESGDQTHVPLLIEALADPSPNLRRLAASALGKLKSREAVEPLMLLVQRDPAPQARQYALKTLGIIADSRAIEVIQRVLQDEHEKPYNKVAAKAALRACTKRG